jgi:hypothetical protein
MTFNLGFDEITPRKCVYFSHYMLKDCDYVSFRKQYRRVLEVMRHRVFTLNSQLNYWSLKK